MAKMNCAQVTPPKDAAPKLPSAVLTRHSKHPLQGSQVPGGAEVELSQSKAAAATTLLKGPFPLRAGAVDTALRDGAIQQSHRERLGLALASARGFLHHLQCLGVSHHGPFPHHSTSKEKIFYSCHYVPFRMHHRFNAPSENRDFTAQTSSSPWKSRDFLFP